MWHHKKCLEQMTIVLQMDIQSRPYGIADIQNLVSLFNDIHVNGASLKIKSFVSHIRNLRESFAIPVALLIGLGVILA